MRRLFALCAASSVALSALVLTGTGDVLEPENAIAIVETLKEHGIANIGMVYNLHHGHGHLQAQVA